MVSYHMKVSQIHATHFHQMSLVLPHSLCHALWMLITYGFWVKGLGFKKSPVCPLEKKSTSINGQILVTHHFNSCLTLFFKTLVQHKCKCCLLVLIRTL
jgi:hypothetical protein